MRTISTLVPVHDVWGQCAVETWMEHSWHLSKMRSGHISVRHMPSLLMCHYPAAVLLTVLWLGLNLLLARI